MRRKEEGRGWDRERDKKGSNNEGVSSE